MTINKFRLGCLDLTKAMNIADSFIRTKRFTCDIQKENNIFYVYITPNYYPRCDIVEITGCQTREQIKNLVLEVQKMFNKQEEVKLYLSQILLSYPEEISNVIKFVGLNLPPYYHTLGAWKQSGYWPGSPDSLIDENGEVPIDSYLANDEFIFLPDLFLAYETKTEDQLLFWLTTKYWWVTEPLAKRIIKTFESEMKYYGFESHKGYYQKIANIQQQEEIVKKKDNNPKDLETDMKQYCKKHGSRQTVKYFSKELGMPAEDIKDMLIKYKIIRTKK